MTRFRGPGQPVTQELLNAADRGRRGCATPADIQLLNAYLRAGGSLRELGGATLLSYRPEQPVSAAVVDPAAVGACTVALTAEQLALCKQLGIAPEDFAREHARLRSQGKVA